MKQLPFFLLLLIAFFSGCVPSYADETFFIENQSSHSVVVRTHSGSQILYQELLQPGESASVPTSGANSENFNDILLIANPYVDSTMIVFDQIKKMESIDIGLALSYEPTMCEKPKKERGCQWIYYITDQHYAEADSI